MRAPDATAITQLLGEWHRGDAQAREQIVALLYAQLRAIARRHLRGEGAVTLDPTDLVHEACLRLLGPTPEWRDRAHFLAIAARHMRMVLIDHARHKRRAKRGGGVAPVTLQGNDLADHRGPLDLLDMNQLFERLGDLYPRKRDVLELHYFGGMSYPEMSHVLNVSEATVDRDLRFAKAWLRRELEA